MNLQWIIIFLRVTPDFRLEEAVINLKNRQIKLQQNIYQRVCLFKKSGPILNNKYKIRINIKFYINHSAGYPAGYRISGRKMAG